MAGALRSAAGPARGGPATAARALPGLLGCPAVRGPPRPRPPRRGRGGRRLARASSPSDRIRARAAAAADIPAEARARLARRLEELQGGQGEAGAAAGAAEPAAGLEAVAEKAAEAITYLQHNLVERDTQVRLLLLAALCRENVLFIGPPGTAKSELGRRLSWVLKGSFFQLLLTKFSVPEELFGPLSLKALEQDEYLRQTDGYLPSVEVAFVDEIFKANSAILNSLLTILNEREFDNGNVRSRVPLVSLVAASNEIPEVAELRALYDRFLLRCEVDSVSEAGLEALLTMPMARDEGPACEDHRDFFSSRETSEIVARADGVAVPPGIVKLLVALRQHLADKCEPPVVVSDRRLLKAVKLLKVSALTNGRAAVSESDCMLLQHALWEKPDEQVKIYEWLVSNIETLNLDVQQIRFLVQGLFGRACKASGDAAASGEVLAELEPVAELLLEEIHAMGGKLKTVEQDFSENIWIGEGERGAVVNAVGPKLEKTYEEAYALALDVLQLQQALELELEPHLLAELLPDYWGSFIRDGVIDEVKPLGTTARASP